MPLPRISRALLLAILASTVAAADATSADATAVNAIDPDHLSTALDPALRISGTRDDQGRLDGVITFMEPGTGKIREIRAFVHGTPEGLFTEYDTNGQLRVQGQTHLGKPVGTWVIYDAKGVVLSGIDCDDPKHPPVSATAAGTATSAAPHDGE
jgi:hypothetical protein